MLIQLNLIQNLSENCNNCIIVRRIDYWESAIKEHVSANHVNLSRVRRFFHFGCPSCSEVYESKAELVTHLASANNAGHSAWKINEAICRLQLFWIRQPISILIPASGLCSLENLFYQNNSDSSAFSIIFFDYKILMSKFLSSVEVSLFFFGQFLFAIILFLHQQFFLPPL